MLVLVPPRRGQYDPAPMLCGIDADVRELVLHMTQLDPSEYHTSALNYGFMSHVKDLGC